MKRIFFIFLFLIIAQSLVSGSTVLENYIKIGLKNNLVLKQEQFSLKISLQALKEARGRFLPSISIEARYSRAGGGRVIDIPIGDMMNPIHQTLNELLKFHGQDSAFPGNLENERIPFLREQEHETKLRIIQPVFHPAVFYYSKIKSGFSKIQKEKVNAFKRELVLQIKESYFIYLKTVKVKEFLENTMVLLKENLRVSESLFRNHKVTEEIVFRSRAEISKLEKQIAEAEKNVRMASSYFNFLLNQPMDTAIETGNNSNRMSENLFDLRELESHALKNRNEFFQMLHAINTAGYGIKLYRSWILPSVTAVVDYGFQGVTYRFTGEDDFWMASLLMSWNLFRGGRDKAKIAQATLEKNRLEAQRGEIENKIRLQVREFYHNHIVARKSVKSAEDLLNSRKRTFQIISKKYEEDMVPQIEYIQARNNYTRAEINRIIARYDFFIKEAYLEYGSALYKFKHEGVKNENK